MIAAGWFIPKGRRVLMAVDAKFRASNLAIVHQTH